MDKTSLEYWYPLIQNAGLRVPKTVVMEMPHELQVAILQVLFGEKPELDPREHVFLDQLGKVVDEAGFPCFIRTGQTSDKHNWKKTCYLTCRADLLKHIYALAEFSECAGLIGLPINQWVVREFLPITPLGSCLGYGGMPVNREFRFFVDGPQYKCFHPYWPLSALQDGGWDVDADETAAYAELCELDYHTFDELKCMASRAGMACGGAWSVDLLETERGWFLTDMAEAHKSFHWEGCEELRGRDGSNS